MSMKRWNIPKVDKQLSKILATECEIPQIVADILVSRKITSTSKAQELLSDELSFESPLALKDMDKAVGRIKQAVEDFESIAVYGDYDCDGVTATTILYSYLMFLGAKVQYYIPKRIDEGYGMNELAIRSLAEQEVSLIITVDNGISAVCEIELANSLGMTVIITDHHQPPEVLPPAFAVVDAHRKDCNSTFKDLAGVGIAFKLVTAMEDGDYAYTLEQFADIAALGTVADIVPLIGENRSIVKYGLQMLAVTDNLGLRALMEVAKISTEKLSSQSLAFGLAPRINAAGRMEEAALAVNLLLSDTEEEATALAQQLEALNASRKEQESTILSDIEQQLGKSPHLLNDRVLTFYSEGWHQGVIGIVSSKVLEKYAKPNLLMTRNDDMLTGSARSVSDYSLFAALTACSDKLLRYGGHKQAAGFTLPVADFSEFKREIEEYSAKHFKVMPSFTYEVDKVLEANELAVETISSLDMLEPFGAQNQQPLFMVSNAKIEKIEPVSENKHVRVSLNAGGVYIKGMCFRMSTEQFMFSLGDEVDCLANITINHYNGKEYLSVIIKDMHLKGFSQDSFFNAKTYYEMFVRHEKMSDNVIKKVTPTRDEIAVIYKNLKNQNGCNGDVEVYYNTFLKIGMNYCKFRLILDVLSDAGLIIVSPILDSITICDAKGKADLNATETMKRLRGTEDAYKTI